MLVLRYWALLSKIVTNSYGLAAFTSWFAQHIQSRCYQALSFWWPDVMHQYALYVLSAQADMVLPLPTLIGIEVVLFALLEYKRYEGFKKTGKSGFLGSYPFDPAGLDSPANREKEIKNGRLGVSRPCCLGYLGSLYSLHLVDL
jgi:hypothetical protein